MIVRGLFTCALIATLLLGGAVFEQATDVADEQATIVGIVQQSTSSETWTVTSVLVPLVPDETVMTDVVFKIEVDRDPPPGYDILFGPEPGDGTAQGMWENPNGEWQFQGTVGFTYLAGSRPHGNTGEGSAMSDGSIIVLRPGTGTDPDRIFFMKSGPTMTVKTARQTRSFTWDPLKPNGMYVEINSSLQISNRIDLPAPHDANNPQRVWVDAVILIAHDAGLEIPDGWTPPPPSQQQQLN